MGLRFVVKNSTLARIFRQIGNKQPHTSI